MRTYEIREPPNIQMRRQQRSVSDDEDLRRELIERIQQVRRLEDGLMQKQEYYDKTRLQIEQRLLESPFEADGFHHRPSQRRWGLSGSKELVQTEPESLADFSGFEESEIFSKDGEIVAMWAETGLLLNRIIADKDLEITELRQHAEISTIANQCKINELETLATSAIESKKDALRELQECKNTVKELKTTIRDLKADESKLSLEVCRYAEAELRIRELEAEFKELQEQKASNSDRSAAEKILIRDLRADLKATSAKLRDAESKICGLEDQVQESQTSCTLNAIASGTNSNMRIQEYQSRCISAESKVAELEAEVRAFEGRARLAEQESSLHKAHASVFEEKAQTSENRYQELQINSLHLESKVNSMQLENKNLELKLEKERAACDDLQQRLKTAEDTSRILESKLRDFETKAAEDLLRATETKFRELEMDRLKLRERALMNSAMLSAQSNSNIKQTKQIFLELTLSLRFKDIHNMKEFESEVVNDISRAADVYPSALQISAVKAGSVVVNLALASSAVDSQGRKANEIAANLVKQSKDSGSRLLQGKHTGKTISLIIKSEDEEMERPLADMIAAILNICDSIETFVQEAHSKAITNSEKQQNEIRKVNAQMQELVMAHAIEKRKLAQEQQFTITTTPELLLQYEGKLHDLRNQLNETKSAFLKRDKMCKNIKQENDKLQDQFREKSLELKEMQRRLGGLEKAESDENAKHATDNGLKANSSSNANEDAADDHSKSRLSVDEVKSPQTSQHKQQFSASQMHLQTFMHHSPELILESLKESSPSVNLTITGACLSMINLASRGRLYLRRMKLKKYVQAILHALQLQERSTDIIVCSLCVLSMLATDHDILSYILSEGNGIQIIIEIARARDELSIQEQACWTLRALAEKTDDSRRAIIQHDGTNILLSALQKHRSDSDICTTAFQALSIILSDGDEICQNVVEGGGLEIIISVMGMHRRRPELQEYGCILIASLVGLSQAREDIRVKAGEVGGLQCAISALKTATGMSVKEKACAAIKSLAANSNVANACKLAELGAIEAILCAITDHLKSSQLVLECCWALRNLAHNNELNKARIAMFDGSEKLINAMKEHEESAAIQEQACWVLLYIAATNSGNAEKVGQCGGVDVILSAMQKHDMVEGVQGQGCWALANLASNSEANSKRMLDRGGIEMVIAAMKAHTSSLGVQAKACRALCRAARHHDPSCKRIRELGGVDAVMAAMRIHKISSTVQHEGTDFLKTMANEFLKTMGLSSPGANHSTSPATPMDAKKKSIPGQSPRTPSSVTSPRAEGKETRKKAATPNSSGLQTPPSTSRLLLMSSEQMEPVTFPSPRWASGRSSLTPDRPAPPVEPK